MIDSVNNSGSNSTNTIADSNSEVSKTEFMQLMIAQLKYQDPLNPTDSVDYSAQLAQFTSLEQLTNLNENMNTFVQANYALTQSVYNTMTTNLIGKEAKISGNEFSNSGQDEVTLGFNLSGKPQSTTIKIYNSSGKLVRTIDDKEFSSGDNKLSWDFTDNDGKALPDGNYTYKVEAKGAGDVDLTATTFLFGNIDSVRFTDDGTAVVVDGVEYAISDILEIVDPTEDDDSGDKTGGK